MDLYWKAVAGILMTVVLGQTISKQEKDLAMVLYIAVCCMAAGIALQYLAPVIVFFQELEKIAGFQENSLKILLKSMAIAMISQIAGTVCGESGSGALRKSLQILSTTVILCLSLPLFSSLLELIQDILGGL